MPQHGVHRISRGNSRPSIQAFIAMATGASLPQYPCADCGSQGPRLRRIAAAHADDFRRGVRRIAYEEIGLRDAVARRDGHELLRRPAVDRRHEERKREPCVLQSTTLRMSPSSATRKELKRAAAAPSITRWS